MPHRRLARKLTDFRWLRWEMGTVIAFHLGTGLVIALAPDHLVVTPATWSIFYYMGRIGMAVAFLATASVAAACWARPLPELQVLTWLMVYMLGAGWIAGFLMSVQRGTGGLYGVVVWGVLLAVWASTAVRLGLRNGDGGTTGVDPRSSRRRTRW